MLCQFSQLQMLVQVLFQRSKKAKYCSENIYGYGSSKVLLPADHASTFDSLP